MGTEMGTAPVGAGTIEDPVGNQLPPPSPLAASQRPYRKQISRAHRRLCGSGGSHWHAGLLASLHFLTLRLYQQRLASGVYNPDIGQDHVTLIF
jgi:hypothetical protein